MGFTNRPGHEILSVESLVLILWLLCNLFVKNLKNK